jgi:hypothetical protein
MRIRRVPAEWLDLLTRPKRLTSDEEGSSRGRVDDRPAVGDSRGEMRRDERDDEPTPDD